MSVGNRGLRLWLAACCFATTALPAAAAEATPDVLTESCTACHGPKGRSPGAIPSIDGLGTEKVKTSLLGFKSGQAPATIMNRIAKGFTDSEIDAIATYLGGGRP
ncbi:c-type cytochrome [Alsobacter sp. SYSU M60028]|uniref:C-type cytochrome n=1 Tax=Alsobacter ponti TaxID=2962936 RepID=A0ABT1LHI6_9HYPH|nr:c-type cytochrome [Alsobacter ponti]MCP8940964.1 c-type cytochrome [Alsobacter ponti]